MLFVNDAYTRQWGIKSEDYAGKLDDEKWPERVADAYRENDMTAVKMSGEPYVTVENVPTVAGSHSESPLVPWNICKFAVDTGRSILVPGMAWRTDSNDWWNVNVGN